MKLTTLYKLWVLKKRMNKMFAKIKNLLKSRTTQNVAAGTGVTIGVLAAVRSIWPDLLPWSGEQDGVVDSFIMLVLIPIISRILAFLRTPEKLDGMKTLLTAWDADVIAVADPDAAIEAIEAAGSRVTGLLVDYHLDRGNGVAAIREIRRRFGDSIPAILITADRSPNVQAAARDEKISVLNKPVKPASLRALLGQWRTQQMVAAE